MTKAPVITVNTIENKLLISDFSGISPFNNKLIRLLKLKAFLHIFELTKYVNTMVPIPPMKFIKQTGNRFLFIVM